MAMGAIWRREDVSYLHLIADQEHTSSMGNPGSIIDEQWYSVCIQNEIGLDEDSKILL